MSLHAALGKLGQTSMPRVLDKIKNGDIRVLSAGADAADDQGFPDPSFSPLTTYRIPCVWEVPSQNRRDADEQAVAGKPEGFLRFSITIPKYFQGEAVAIGTKDRIELAQSVGSSDYVILEITAVINDSNVVWVVLAMEIDAQ